MKTSHDKVSTNAIKNKEIHNFFDCAWSSFVIAARHSITIPLTGERERNLVYSAMINGIWWKMLQLNPTHESQMQYNCTRSQWWYNVLKVDVFFIFNCYSLDMKYDFIPYLSFSRVSNLPRHLLLLFREMW